MKHGKPLRRKTPLARGESQLRRTRLKPVSDKRQGERPLRDAVVEAALQRAEHRCEGQRLKPHTCRGRLDVHEFYQRSVVPGSHLVESYTLVLCRSLHDWIDDNIAEAHECGLLRHSWEVPLRKGVDSTD